MAEAAGLALSAISLLTLFQTCLNTYDQILRLKHKNDDLKYFLNMIQFEHHKLFVLMPDLTSPQPDILQTLICDSLDVIGTILDELLHLIHRHVGALNTADKSPRILANVRVPGSRVFRAAAWVGSDGPRMETLITRLGNLNDRLSSLVPTAQRASVQLGFMARSVATFDARELRDIQVAAQGHHSTIALAANIKASRIEEFAGTNNTSGMEFKSARISDLDNFEWFIPVPQHKWKTQDGSTTSVKGRNISLAEAMKQPRVLGRYFGNKTLPQSGAGIPVLVEWREGFRSTKSPSSYQYRLDQLTHILGEMGSNSASIDEKAAIEPGKATTAFSDLGNLSLEHTSTISLGVLPCLGWTASDSTFSRVGLIFRLPLDDLSVPISLHDRILRDRRMNIDAPPLGVRFTMAQGLAQELANLIVLGWVHKGIRSDNVIIVDEVKSEVQRESYGIDSLMIGDGGSLRSGSQKSEKQQLQELVQIQAQKQDQYQYQQQQSHQRLYLTGFSYAKPEVDNSDGVSTVADLSVLPLDSINYVFYRPPPGATSKSHFNEAGDRVDPVNGTIRPDGMFDIYALGIILLEIGLWRTMRSLYDDLRRRDQQHKTARNIPEDSGRASSHFPQSLGADEFLRSDHLRRLIETLGARAGSIYQGVVKKCLGLYDLELQTDFKQQQSHDELQLVHDVNENRERDYAQFLQGIVGNLSRCKA